MSNMIERYPDMDIYFPPQKVNEVLEGFSERADGRWSLQELDAMDRPAAPDWFYFHCDASESTPACTLGINQKNEGHWVVENIVPDEDQPPSLTIDQYKNILIDFESNIAEPIINIVGGIIIIGSSVYRLDDYFSRKSIQLLERFCHSSNQSDSGTHPADQRKWMTFLFQVFRDETDVPCDVFGKCLKNTKWWRSDGVDRLVNEYDFALNLLKMHTEQDP